MADLHNITTLLLVLVWVWSANFWNLFMGPGPGQLGFGFRGEAGWWVEGAGGGPAWFWLWGEAGWWVGGAGGDCPKHGGSHCGKIFGSIFVNMKYANAYTLPWF